MTNKHNKTAHFIGIGGIGMSGIARMYLSMGWSVQGSDLKSTPILTDLEALGVKVFIGHKASFVHGADVVVYSSSISGDHPERLEALRKNIPVIHRAEALAEVCKNKYTIAVTGTHGKTTTTSLIGMILREAGRDPSIVVGGVVNFFGGNACVGTGKEIVIEADESDSSFLKFNPDMEVITNIEEEHMDHFRSMDAVENAYRLFIGRMAQGGKWFGCGDEPGVRKMAGENLRSSVLYGFEKSSGLYATQIVECPDGERGISFNVYQGERFLGPLRLKIMGRHNALNSLAAVGVGLELGISFSVIRRALEKYEGARRRFDVKYDDGKTMVVDDYAHHPTEIRKTLMAAKALGKRSIIALFQPHRYTRTAGLLNDFIHSFDAADKLFITDIYAASEKPIPGVDAEMLCRAITKKGHSNVSYVARKEALSALESHVKDGDLVMVLGAGDICQVSDEIAASLIKKGGIAKASADQAKLSSNDIFSSIQGKVLRHEPLSKHTSLRVGGPIDFWIEPVDDRDLSRVIKICSQKQLPFYMFGFGSNLLLPDEGMRGVGIHLTSPYFKEIRIEGNRVFARAGIPNTLFIQNVVEKNLGGCEFLLGIPGNIGGAIAMNAGSHKQSLDVLIAGITVMDFEGNIRRLSKEQIPFRYRSSGIVEPVILEGEFVLTPGQKAESLKRLEEYKDYRQKTQDLIHPSAGCMFKNPSNHECSSGKLIEDAGLKGMRIGNAQVSDRHANFIINLGGATSGDILHLMREVQKTVKQKFNVDLETEVKIL